MKANRDVLVSPKGFQLFGVVTTLFLANYGDDKQQRKDNIVIGVALADSIRRIFLSDDSKEEEFDDDKEDLWELQLEIAKKQALTLEQYPFILAATDALKCFQVAGIK